MKSYKINGKLDKTEYYCPVCRNGEIFTTGLYNTDPKSGECKEYICSVCNRKYKQKYIGLSGFKLENGVKKRTTTDEGEKFVCEKENLNTDNKVIHMIKIVENYKSEVKKMRNLIAEKREEYDNTGICKDHIWIESNPFRTSEGTFTIKNCAICRKGRLTYKGVTYEDDLIKLVGYLADMGILNNKKQEELDNLFKIDKKDLERFKKQETPTNNIIDEPSFKLDIPVF